jgi:hypothetical protein
MTINANSMDENAERDFDYSRQLDVHRWSDSPEANAFIDTIYKDHFSDKTSENTQKKHLKIVLLDLYVAWIDDPKLCIAYSRNVNDYKRGRYNALRITKTTIEVVGKLESVGLVLTKKGHYHRETEGQSHVSRMWPTEKLIKMFSAARFGIFDVGYYKTRECIVRRDAEKNDIEYKDTTNTRRWRSNLSKYNALLAKTHIDVTTLEKPSYVVTDKWKKQKTIPINLSNKFVRRIFNRKNWKKGGRFYGGFWQSLPSKLRPDIRINGEYTVEVDYSGLHIVLLYAELATNYWVDKGANADPYTINVDGLDDWSAEQKRAIAKAVILVGVNSANEKEAFNAVRIDKADYHLPDDAVLTDKLLRKVLNALKELHPSIADKLCSGAGIDLQYTDSQITEKLINHFTDRGVALLSIHDSYIAPVDYAFELREKMDEFFGEVTGLPDNVDDWFEKLGMSGAKTKQIGYSGELELDDPEKHRTIMAKIENTDFTRRYKAGLNEHINYMKSLP